MNTRTPSSGMTRFAGKNSNNTTNLLSELTRSVFLAWDYSAAILEVLKLLDTPAKAALSECRSKPSGASEWLVTHQTGKSVQDGSESVTVENSQERDEFFKPSLDVVDEIWTAEISGTEDRSIPEALRSEPQLFALSLQISQNDGRNDLFRFIYTEQNDDFRSMNRLLADLLPELKTILKKKYSNEKIKRSELRYKSFFNEDLNPSFIATPDGDIKDCNQAFVDLFGFKTRKAALESNFNNFFTNYMHQVFFWESLLREEEINNYEMPASLHSGETIHIMMKAVGSYDQNEELREIVGYIQDITNQKKVEVALRKSEERYRSLIETTNDWIWEIDEHFRFTYSSLKIQTILGYELNSVLGKSIFELMPEGSKQQAKEKFIEISMEQKAFVSKEHAFEDSTGGITIFETSGIPLFSNSGIFQGYRGIAKDITERKKSERQIARMNDELENKVIERTKMLQIANKELEAFSYSVSHDLRAPLRSIDGFSQALIEDYGETLDDTAQNYLNRVRSAAQRMSTLIDDMIKLAKVSRTTLAKKQINLSDIAGPIAESLKEHDPERDSEFIIEPDIMVTGDPNLMKVALQNLMENAWKFTSKQDQTRIEVGTKSINGEITCYVKDNGAGFDMNYAKKLFTPFQRLHKEQDFPGTGIGLSTVQRIIHRHLGRIWAESQIEEGAVFYFTLKPNSDLEVENESS